MINLPLEIIYDPVNLLDHCFHQDFHLGSNLDCGNRPTVNDVTFILNWFCAWNQLTKAAVAASRFNAATAVLSVQHRDSSFNPPD